MFKTAKVNAKSRQHVQAMHQQLLAPPTEKELAALREKLSDLVGGYISLEEQKKAADADYNERMADIWDEVKALRARITEAEEAVG